MAATAPPPPATPHCSHHLRSSLSLSSGFRRVPPRPRQPKKSPKMRSSVAIFLQHCSLFQPLLTAPAAVAAPEFGARCTSAFSSLASLAVWPPTTGRHTTRRRAGYTGLMAATPITYAYVATSPPRRTRTKWHRWQPNTWSTSFQHWYMGSLGATRPFASPGGRHALRTRGRG